MMTTIIMTKDNKQRKRFINRYKNKYLGQVFINCSRYFSNINTQTIRLNIFAPPTTEENVIDEQHPNFPWNDVFRTEITKMPQFRIRYSFRLGSIRNICWINNV